MSVQQPTWECIGHVGDVDPIAYGGAFVYQDTTGVYCHEMTVFEPASDDLWRDAGSETPVETRRVLLERDSTREWWYARLDALVSYTGQSLTDLQQQANGTPLERAQLYLTLAQYFGMENFDDAPDTMTEAQAYARYSEEMKQARRPQAGAPAPETETETETPQPIETQRSTK